MKDNNEKFSQVCVWPGTVLHEDQYDEFVDYFKKEMNARVTDIETVITLPDKDENGDYIEGTGGRHDIFFRVHEDDIMGFAINRLMVGIRWWEDVVGNDNHTIYPKEIIDKYPLTW